MPHVLLDKSDTRGILEALVRLGCEATWPKFFYCDADSAILKIMREMDVSLRNLQYELFSEHGATFEVCPVGGHERQGLVERRIRTVQSSLKEMGLDKMRVHSMGLQTMCKMIENTLNNLPYGFTKSRSDSNQSLFKLISPNLLRHGRNNNRALSGPVRLSADNSQMLKDVQKRNEAWFKIFRDSCVLNLVLRQKWFKNERDLSVGDVVFFRKTESDLGEGDWSVGDVELVIASKDGCIRKVIVKYRNSTEDFDRMTQRNARKVIRLCNVDDSDLTDDLSWVQKRVEMLQKQKSSLPDVSRGVHHGVCGDMSKCLDCCCLSHCQVRFHSIGKKPLVFEMEDPFSSVGLEFKSLCCSFPDMDATVANMPMDGNDVIAKSLEDENYV